MKALIILLFALVFISCNTSKKEEYLAVNSSASKKSQEHPGKRLMETNCYVCHSPSANHDDRLAPPMIAVKKHYLTNDTTKEEFVKAMQDWIKNPSDKNAKMYGAVRRFGIMPKTPFSEEAIKQIADYMFDNEIDQPEWFNKHFNNKKTSH